jgi:hypothetical protein
VEQNMPHTLTAYVESYPETSLYVETVPGIPGALTQDATLDALQKNLLKSLIASIPMTKVVITAEIISA